MTIADGNIPVLKFPGANGGSVGVGWDKSRSESKAPGNFCLDFGVIGVSLP